MPHVIAWCGFLGAWLLVAGPLDQAVREIAETEFEREVLDQAKEKVEEPPPVSRWWILLPPVWYFLRWRRGEIYRHQIGEAMPDEDLLAPFWFGVVGMLVLCVWTTLNRARHRRRRPAVD